MPRLRRARAPARVILLPKGSKGLCSKYMHRPQGQDMGLPFQAYRYRYLIIHRCVYTPTPVYMCVRLHIIPQRKCVLYIAIIMATWTLWVEEVAQGCYCSHPAWAHTLRSKVTQRTSRSLIRPEYSNYVQEGLHIPEAEQPRCGLHRCIS